MSTTAIYSDQRILKEKEKGLIIIEPFKKEQLNNCSYNVTLSKFFFREKLPQHGSKAPAIRRFLNPWKEQDVAKVWEEGKISVATSENASLLGLKEGDEYILLDPYETILIATNEFIGAREHITTMLKARSSASRSFLSVAHGAGWGDVGFFSRWGIAVTNMSRAATTVLPVGSSIAQIVFMECGYPLQSYQGKYQLQDSTIDIKALMEAWTPAMILPQYYKEFPVEEKPGSSEEEDEVDSPEEDSTEEESEEDGARPEEEIAPLTTQRDLISVQEESGEEVAPLTTQKHLISSN
jgi:dCTP deaminase